MRLETYFVLYMHVDSKTTWTPYSLWRNVERPEPQALADYIDYPTPGHRVVPSGVEMGPG
jgi:hypothetical protein